MSQINSERVTHETAAEAIEASRKSKSRQYAKDTQENREYLVREANEMGLNEYSFSAELHGEGIIEDTEALAAGYLWRVILINE